MMTRPRIEPNAVQCFILTHVERHPQDIVKITSQHFAISRQAVNKHLQKLVAESRLLTEGATRNKHYRLVVTSMWSQSYPITATLAEDVVWCNDISAALGPMANNVESIWHYGFTEMFNNAIDHSGGTTITVTIYKTAAMSEMRLHDDGVGVFKKIQQNLHLLNERHAVLELAKGKLSTDPDHHSGEGIFFSSRLFDVYQIASGDVSFSHQQAYVAGDLLMTGEHAKSGTAVRMKLENQSLRTTKAVFDEYAPPSDDYSFNKTVVPVNLAQYGTAALISRSQAKRLLARIALFKVVVLDFSQVEFIGQAFADEIFRVFVNQHPQIELSYVHASPEIQHMIRRVYSTIR